MLLGDLITSILPLSMKGQRILSDTAQIDRVLDSNRLTRFQTTVIVLCAFTAMLDGLSTQTIGLVAPAIASDWHVAAASFGPVFGSSLLSGMIGALVLGQASDYFGRKPILIIAILLFALSSLATPLTNSISSLLIVRLITGFGLGGALPVVISVTSEFSPKRLRMTIVAIMYCGFPLGSVIGGVIAAQLIPTYGWASVFYVGGVVPLILLPFFAVIMPESLSFLAMKGKAAEAERISRQIGLQLSDVLDGHSVSRGCRSPVSRLFTEGRALGTLLLWAALFLSLLLTVFLVNWMPLLTSQAGLGTRTAVLGVAALNLGGIVGCFLIGWLCKRCSSIMPIAIAYGLGAVAVWVIGLASQSSQTFLTAAFVAGLLTVGSQMCAIALSASMYETSLRSTGVGWAFGIGRIGAVIGPVLGGVLVAQEISLPNLFLVAGAVSLGAAAAVLGIARTTPDQFFVRPAHG
jgi:MFS transporter, AAHS family, 4-hydroxybenzoate transporter